jgi:RNA exonuclease 4
MYFALDCEMVGVGPEGLDSALARVSIINWDNEIVLDTYVTVQEEVTDYRTFVSGIRPEHIESESAMGLEQVRALVASILKGKILIGHALENDLKAVGLQHPAWDIRDTAKYAPFMRTVQNFQEATAKDVLVPKKLKELVLEHLQRDIQVIGKSHSPVEDSIAAMDLYKKCRNHWEMQLSQEVHRVQPQVSLPQPIPQPLQNQSSRSPLRDMRSHFNNVRGGNQLLFGQSQAQAQAQTHVPTQVAPSPQHPSAQFVVPMPLQHQHYNYNQFHPTYNHVHGHHAHGYMHAHAHAHAMTQSHSSGRGKVTSAKRTQELARAKVVAALHQQRMKWQQKQQQQQQRQQ